MLKQSHTCSSDTGLNQGVGACPQIATGSLNRQRFTGACTPGWHGVDKRRCSILDYMLSSPMDPLFLSERAMKATNPAGLKQCFNVSFNS